MVASALLLGVYKAKEIKLTFWVGLQKTRLNMNGKFVFSSKYSQVLTFVGLKNKSFISDMEKCYENLLKYFVFLCNLIFALAGACLVGFGAYVQVLIMSFSVDIFLLFVA